MNRSQSVQVARGFNEILEGRRQAQPERTGYGNGVFNYREKILREFNYITFVENMTGKLLVAWCDATVGTPGRMHARIRGAAETHFLLYMLFTSTTETPKLLSDVCGMNKFYLE